MFFMDGVRLEGGNIMSVFIMCNPLVDVVIQAPAGMVEDLGVRPGSMNLVEYKTIEKIFAKNMPCVRGAGGSGANTARGLAWLAGTHGRAAREACDQPRRLRRGGSF